MPIWLQCVLGICGPIIAGYSVYIGYQQWKISAYKLKHDLFEKRWNVYAATNDAIVLCLNGSNDEAQETYLEFKKKRMDARFLFAKEVNDYLDKINNAIPELKMTNEKLKSEAMRKDSLERSNLEKQAIAQAEWLKSQVDVIVPMFHRYLNLST